MSNTERFYARVAASGPGAKFTARTDEGDEVTILIVPDEACPSCGAYWGNPDPLLDYPNRPKVDDWFRCYNPKCATDYYRGDEVSG